MTKLETGMSETENGGKAGREAAKEALEGMGEESADFAFVFSSPENDYSEVIEAVKEETGVEKLIGSSTAGEFSDKGVTSGGVAVGLIRSDTMKFFTSMGHGISEDVLEATEEATSQLPEEVEGYPHLAGVNFHEGLAGVGEEVAMAVFQETGRIPFTGGSAGDDMRFEGTRVFTEDEIAEDAVALAIIASEKPFALAVDHGHKPISPPFEVTKAEGSTVYELDDRPAIEVWKEQIERDARARYDIDVDEVDPESKEFGRLLTRYEFGLSVENGNYKVRWPGPTAAEHGDDGPLEFACGIPEGVVTRIVHATDTDEIDSQKKAGLEARDIMDELGEEPAGALAFDCICHANILQEDFDEAVDAISEALKVPFVGFETYGEVCMREGELSGYHNATTSILLIPR
jgi:methyl-accepting chemotaxis protein